MPPVNTFTLAFNLIDLAFRRKLNLPAPSSSAQLTHNLPSNTLFFSFALKFTTQRGKISLQLFAYLPYASTLQAFS